MSCDNYARARTFVENGLGFMIETYPLVAKDIEAGRLVQLLPKVRLRPVDVFAVYPANSTRDSFGPDVRRLLAFVGMGVSGDHKPFAKLALVLAESWPKQWKRKFMQSAATSRMGSEPTLGSYRQ